jgi:hypothetical protein
MMFPDISGLKAAIELNTKTQEQLLGQMKILQDAVKSLTTEIGQLRFQQKAADTNSTGPK